eukprot:6472623-Amphidinium_carterae.1
MIKDFIDRRECSGNAILCWRAVPTHFAQIIKVKLECVAISCACECVHKTCYVRQCMLKIWLGLERMMEEAMSFTETLFTCNCVTICVSCFSPFSTFWPLWEPSIPSILIVGADWMRAYF